MDEFFVFLTIGLLLIVAMVVIFSGSIGLNIPGSSSYGGGYRGGGYYYGTTTTSTTILYIDNKTEYLIGTENVSLWRTIGPAKINASYLSGTSGYNVPEKYLFNGLLFGSNSLEISADMDIKDLVGAYVKFDIERANGYGGLVIKLNDQVISDKKLDVGTHTIFVNKSLIKESNSIEVYPTSSLWRMWAPDVYYIKNFEFSLQNQLSKPSHISFNVYQEEIDKLTIDRGRIMLDLQDHKGVLKIRLNGNDIFSDKTSGYQAVYFDQKNLKHGENSLDFYAQDNSTFEGAASLLFFYQTTRDNTITRDFEVTSDRYKYLNISYGAIRFNVTHVLTRGGIAVTVENKDGNRTAYFYDMLREQNYAMFFNATQVTVGANTVRIRPVDNATFYVSNISVQV